MHFNFNRESREEERRRIREKATRKATVELLTEKVDREKPKKQSETAGKLSPPLLIFASQLFWQKLRERETFLLCFTLPKLAPWPICQLSGYDERGVAFKKMEKGSSSSSSSGGGGADSINGLKFGKKIYFENVGSRIGGVGEEEEAPPPRSPAKKGRTAVVHGGQPPRCQVEGCLVDLSDSKAYYCRHKVCGVHSKSPRVIVAGLEQRFCQQCSRFHQLPEFDQGKRSCRRRLAGHNERRRKPPLGPLLSSRYASLSPSVLTGGLEVDMAAYSAFGGRDPWPETSNQTMSTGNFQLPWQMSSPAASPPPNLLQGSTTRSSYAAAEDCFSGIPDSTSALSLLSNEPSWGSRSQTLDLGVNGLIAGNGAAGVDPGGPIGRYSSWDFKGDNSLHEMPPDMGLGQNSHSANNPYSMDLRLAGPGDGRRHELEPSDGYDSSSHHMNWSL